MNKLLIAALGLMPATSLWAALPPQVEADRHVLRAQQELKAGAMDQALAEFALAEKQGSLDKTVTLPEGFYTGYATALAQSGKTAQARQVLENYLNKYREQRQFVSAGAGTVCGAGSACRERASGLGRGPSQLRARRVALCAG